MSRVYAGHVSLNAEKRFSTRKAFIAQAATHAPIIETRYLMDEQLYYTSSITQLAFVGIDTRPLVRKRRPAAKLIKVASINYQRLNPDKIEDDLYMGVMDLAEDYYQRTNATMIYTTHKQQQYFLNKKNMIKKGPLPLNDQGNIDFKEQLLLVCREKPDLFYAYCLQKEVITDAQAYQSGALIGPMAHEVHNARRNFHREGLGGDPDMQMLPPSRLLL